MNPCILVFSRGETELGGVDSALTTAGFAVVVATGLSELHDCLMRHRIAAVIVRRHVLFSHRIHPVSHLKEAKSAIGIISWAIGSDGIPKIRVNGEKSTETARAAEILRVALSGPAGIVPDGVADTLPRYQSVEGTMSRRDDRERDPPFPPCHRMLAITIEAIADSGERGIGTGELSDLLWGMSERRRAGDVHSYVSKARKLLASTGSRGRIVRFERRYRMEGTPW